jgi:hypothetical protein
MSEYKFTRLKQGVYLDNLRQGMRRGKAAEAVGVSRQIVARYRKDHPEFRDEEDQAEIEACDPVEDALYTKALGGNLGAIIFWLLNRSGGRWLDKRQNPVVQIQPPEANAQEMVEELKKLLESKSKRKSGKKDDGKAAE